MALTYAQGHISAVSVELKRPVGAICHMLAGQAPDAALAIIGALFSVCCQAHRIAGARALEQARGVRIPEYECRRRARLLAVERLRESLLRLLQDWHYPGATEKNAREGIRRCQRLLTLLQSPSDKTPDGVEQAIVGLRNWSQALRCTPAQEQRWLVNRVQRWRDIELGPAVPGLMPELTSELVGSLGNEQQNGFCSAPMLNGQSRHSGPAVAGAEATAADEVIGKALGALLAQTDQALAQLAEPGLESTPSANRGQDGVGYGWALTARGWLLHRVELDGERVGRWQILAPTDWNFHTDGIVRQRLMGVKIERNRAEALARDLILSIDPCVGFGVTRHDA
ncbi:nickel-dependent hydrogenase large subunit [Marinobacterium ramblicola]|uniref:nickel-dependent hydrogenase large subunit n=1 Tax=Marinobacterium ramblicola TaxID=2849041 RepID=UPI001C2D2F3D